MTKFKTMPLAVCTLRKAGLSGKDAAKFGLVRKNKDGSLRAHQGVDLASDSGFRVYAVEDGVIVDVKDSEVWGKVVTLACKVDNKPLYPFYAHLSAIKVNVGQNVKAGDVIALTGSTGNARGMVTIKDGGHLHFGVKSRLSAGLGLGGWVDPLPLLELKEG